MEQVSAERSCGWMSGPKDASLDIPAVKWWFAISRDVLAKGYRMQQTQHRAPAACHRTPNFCSPLANKH
jgi:hypothetical protein